MAYREEDVVEDKLESRLILLEETGLVEDLVQNIFGRCLRCLGYRDRKAVEHGLNRHALCIVQASGDHVHSCQVCLVLLQVVEALR